MPTQPADIVNRALDECGLEEIGDLLEGSDAAKRALRIYDPTLRELLAAAHWNFARKQIALTLIGDASGQNNPNKLVPAPWGYMYDWPIDCVHARFVPRTAQVSNISPPIFTEGSVSSVASGWNSPTPFIVSSAPYPNDVDGQWYLTEGHDPDQTRVILSNQLGANLVYTGIMQYPDAWDPLFSQAMVAVLAARLAMPLIADKKFAREVRGDNIAIARTALDAARVRDGDEGWTVADHTPDWIRARTAGGGAYGVGILYYPWCQMSLEDAGGVY